MKKIYLLFTLAILMSSCEKEEVPVIEELQENAGITVEKISFNSLPVKVRDLLSRKPHADGQKGEKERVKFGSPKTNIPAIRNKNKEGIVSYTVALKKLKDSLKDFPYFDNAVITELEQDVQKINILRYKPTAEWYYSAERDIKKFTGTIEFHTAEGELLGKLSMLNGEGIEKPEDQKGFSTVCTYTFNNSLCVGDVNGDSGTYLCTINYTETCTTTYTSSLSTPTDEDATLDQGGSSGGTGGSTTTTTTTTTTPIVVEEEVKVINDLDNPCASLIFNNLHLSAIDSNISNRLLTPDGLYVSLSDRVLNLFNNLKSLDYTIKDASLYDKTASTTGLTTTLSETYISNATELSMARTMIHEMVHAYLNYQYSPTESNDLSFRHLMDWYAEKTGLTVNSNTFHHEFMGGFINAIAYSLWQWDSFYGTGGNLGWKYYREMAAGGFTWKDKYGNWQSYNSFDQLFPTTSAKASARQTIENEATSTNSKGSKCD